MKKPLVATIREKNDRYWIRTNCLGQQKVVILQPFEIGILQKKKKELYVITFDYDISN